VSHRPRSPRQVQSSVAVADCFTNKQCQCKRSLRSAEPLQGILASCENVSSANFYSWPWEKHKPCDNISSDAKHFSIYVGEETFCTDCSRLRCFIIICNSDECKGWTETRVWISYTMNRLEVRYPTILRPNSFITAEVHETFCEYPLRCNFGAMEFCRTQCCRVFLMSIDI